MRKCVGEPRVCHVGECMCICALGHVYIMHVWCIPIIVGCEDVV